MKKNSKIVSYEQLVAGLLLKFKTIDILDSNLLTQKFENITKTKIENLWVFVDQISPYIEFKDNDILSLKDNLTPDSFIKEKNKTLSEILSEIAGDTVMEFIKNLDIKQYKNEKEQSVNDNKKKVLTEANVLLISDSQADYDALITYGFKNVDYFKSIIRANAYFAKHPNELEEYHIILNGSQSIQHRPFQSDIKLDKMTEDLRKRKGILKASLRIYNYANQTKYTTCLADTNNHISLDVCETSYGSLLDRIVENTLLNHTLEKVNTTKHHPKYTDYINPNRIVSTKKSDLKILYLSNAVFKETHAKLKDLNLNITFKEDNNDSLLKNVNAHLGDYDIIIASSMFSSNLLSMYKESTEQCKDTGRELTLLVTYNENVWGVDHNLGYGIILNYRFGGNIAPDGEYHSKSFRTLKQQIKVNLKDESWKEIIQRDYTLMKETIGASVNFYNDALIKNGKEPLKDLDLKSSNELEDEYTLVYESERKRKLAELEHIILFDDIKCSIIDYLNHKKCGLINQTPEGLRITEKEETIKVEVVFQGKTLCALIFPKINKYDNENLRIFKIQTSTNKGNLTAPETIGVYTSKYASYNNIPPLPNDKQMNTLTSIKKKIDTNLTPIISEANKRQEKQSKTINLKPKK